ncbi:polysaccharide deacetylase family protein [Staphylococcus haemolyticus]|uniref:polysaccharide deacetylase family protein n=1 Tax=Staphylococcus haemolyticus TaxID=1283 RepID=UPI00187A8EF9|nr:polysaccharide deacetylase family protein [Staphylococcus haemolyticus]MBE7361618.1 polysaccharide deacetylase family protein [Staphylococcus haemolyticus]
MRRNLINNYRFLDFPQETSIEIKQGDFTPITVKLDSTETIKDDGKDAKVFLINTDNEKVFETEVIAKNKIVEFSINKNLPKGRYFLEIVYNQMKFPSKDYKSIIINGSASLGSLREISVISTDDIKNRFISEAKKELALEINSIISNKFNNYINENQENFKGQSITITNHEFDEKGNLNITFSDETSVKIPKGKDGTNGIDGLSHKATPIGRNLISGNVETPMFTFIDDDGRIELKEKWLPILKEKKNKLTIALVTEWVESKQPTVLQWEEIHEWEKKYGVEFVSHMHTHPHAVRLTDEQIDYEFKTARDILKREDLTYDIIVQPFGENTDSVRKISRKYARANFGIVDEINTVPYNTFRMKRVPLGEERYTTFDQYKEIIDNTIKENGWLVFKSHSQYTSFDENQIEIIKQIIDYCREKGVLEVTLEEGLNLTGNLIDIGDYDAKARDVDYYILDNKGQVHSNKERKDYYTLKYNSVNFDTGIGFFNDTATTIVPITSTNAVDFPKRASGMLMTVKTVTLSLSYQLYFPYNADIVYKRRWNDKESKWTGFVSLNNGMREEFTRHYTSNTIIDPNSTKDVIISNGVLDKLSFKNSDLIIGTNEKPLPDGILYNLYIPEESKIAVRFTNVTSNQITIPATFFNFKISISS